MAMKRSADRREHQGERQRWNRSSRGFSLVEAIIAIAVLSVGVLSLARLVPFATRTDFGARTDSTATFIAMRQMEQMLAQPWDVTSFTDAADDAGATATENMACTCGGAPCTGNAGVAFVGATETLNFTPGAIVAGYRRLYTINNSTAAGTVKVNQGVYDVRWHVTCNLYGIGNAGLWKITVAARPVGTVPGMISIPAHVQAVKMK
jgi:prepilin-type N-terminal cleavage/methylation domain-containing protein